MVEGIHSCPAGTVIPPPTTGDVVGIEGNGNSDVEAEVLLLKDGEDDDEEETRSLLDERTAISAAGTVPRVLRGGCRPIRLFVTLLLLIHLLLLLTIPQPLTS